MPRPGAALSILSDVRTILRQLGRTPLILLLTWLLTVWWGEHTVFTSSARRCAWNSWETWSESSNPHHVLLVADPQIVDPHTYPDRPWPLSSLTILYTDLYMKRSYTNLLYQLQPDATIFLGDLFDGGREWGSSSYSSPEDRYKQYGQDFWLQEYKRFQGMFTDTWYDAGIPLLPNNEGRRLIASLPGNHDLGFAGGINSQVKDRFVAHFGPSNRIDVFGNHTFVFLDTVSLSAMDQVDPQTGSHGVGDGSAAATQTTNIWKPVENYLQEASSVRERAVKQQIRFLGAQSGRAQPRTKLPVRLPKNIETPSDETEELLLVPSDELRVHTSQFPTIILSHVPLYRSESSHCGPNRERGTAISISAGYQYQNVLTPLISKDIVDHLDASQIAMIYSGDDHDYCEIEHDEFTGRIKEITVKSMSWAMGIRKPGVQLASLWNPIDLDTAIMPPSPPGAAKDTNNPDQPGPILNMPRNTVQNHLCLLPDQLTIFIRYAQLLSFTLLTLLIRAILHKPTQTFDRPTTPDLEKHEPLLYPQITNLPPTTTKEPSSPPLRPRRTSLTSKSSSSSSASSTTTAAAHAATRTPRKPLNSYGYGNSRSASPLPISASEAWQADSDDWGNPTTEHDRVVYARVHHNAGNNGGRRRWWLLQWWLFRRSTSRVREFGRSIVFVGVPTVVFYLWLLVGDM